MKINLPSFLARFSRQQLFAFVGVAITVLTAIIAITISLYQQGKGPLAPTAPGSNPAASTISSDTCTVVVDVPSDTAIFCDKKVYLDEFDNAPGVYHLRNLADAYRAGENLVFSIDVTNNQSQTTQIALSDVLGGGNLDYLQFLDSDCGINAYNPTTKVLSCPSVAYTSGQTITRNFRVKILESAPVGTSITNQAEISSDITAQCSATVRVVAEAGAQECNELCETDKECADPLRCIDTGDGYRCRLPENPDNDLCEPEPTPTNTPSNTPTSTPGQGGPTATPTTIPTNTPVPTATNSPIPTNTPLPTVTNTPVPTNTPLPTATNTPVPTATPGTGGPTATPTSIPTNTPVPTNTLVPTATATLPPGVTPSSTPVPTATPTPAVGCNDSCTSNADCTNSSHFCFNDNGSYVCRLDSNPTSTVCAPADGATSTPVPTGTQTPTLPLAGNNNTTTVILVTAGVIVLILGALGLLFLL